MVVILRVILVFLCMGAGTVLAQERVNLIQSEIYKAEPNHGGKTISLNFQDIKVRAVLQILAEFSGINMVISDKVGGNISLNLNDVPWEQALDVILETRSLVKRRVGETLLISPSRARVLETGAKNEYTTQQNAAAMTPLHSELMQLQYAKAADVALLLKDRDSRLLSPRGAIMVDVRTNRIWIEDIDRRLIAIRQLVKRLDIPVQQVLIEARIVNVNKEFSRDLGLRFGVAKTSLSRMDSFPGQALKPDQVQLADRLNFDLVTAPVTGTAVATGIAFAKLGKGILLDLELSALESEGMGEIISSPRLITTNQQTATIESGEEIPYQEKMYSGATAVVFKKAVLSLKVTPEITPDRRILMDLHINQDIPSAKLINNVPSILTKELQTRVMIEDGCTIVLGGIYKEDVYKTVNRVPFLGSLPLVGAAFRSESTAKRNEELLIFITPRIIREKLSI